METKLPDKDSELIRVALADLRAVEKDSRYRVEMSDWHDSGSHLTKCEVCLAGSVMAKTLGVNPRHYSDPDDFDDATAYKLFRLDELRRGIQYKNAARTHLSRNITPYEMSHEQFHADMNKFADDLEAAGF